MSSWLMSRVSCRKLKSPGLFSMSLKADLKSSSGPSADTAGAVDTSFSPLAEAAEADLADAVSVPSIVSVTA